MGEMAMKPKSKTKKERPPKRSREERIFDNILKVTQQYVSGRSYRPQAESELRRQLDISEQHYELFSDILQQLVSKGILEFSNGRYLARRAQGGGVATGIIRVHARGFGFLQCEDKVTYPQDIFVPKHLTQNAVDGDRVEVLVNHENISEKGPEGRVLTILERSRTHIGGIIRSIDRNENAIAYVPLLGEEKSVIVTSPSDISLRVGDRVVIEVDDWGSPSKPAYGRVSHSLGHISDASRTSLPPLKNLICPANFRCQQ